MLLGISVGSVCLQGRMLSYDLFYLVFNVNEGKIRACKSVCLCVCMCERICGCLCICVCICMFLFLYLYLCLFGYILYLYVHLPVIFYSRQTY